MNYQHRANSEFEDASVSSDPSPSLDDMLADDLNAGDLVFIDETVLEFLTKLPRGPHVFWNSQDHKQVNYHTAELLKLIEQRRYYRAGRERFSGKPFEAPETMQDGANKVFVTIPDGPREKAKVKWRYVAHFRQRTIAAESEGLSFHRNVENAKIVIEEIDAQIDAENATVADRSELIIKPRGRSPRTLLRWLSKEMELNLQEAGLAHLNSMRKPASRLPQIVFDTIARTIRECMNISGKITPSKVHILTSDAIDAYNQTHGTFVPKPSPSTTYDVFTHFDAWIRLAAREGVRQADLEYGAIGKHPRPDRILDLVELDHHKFDIHTSLPDSPLGKSLKSIGISRFWICLALDVHSGYPLGFTISFEPGGLLPAMMAIDHAIRPKTYIAEMYPEIRGTLLGFGKPLKIRYDNAKEFVGHQISGNLARIGVGFELSIPKIPNSKPYVESHFGTIEHDFVHWLKGSTGSNSQDKGDRVPQKEALLDLDSFSRLFHQYLIEVYSRRPQQDLDYDTPEQRWLRGATSPSHRPRPLSAAQLDQWDIVTTIEQHLDATDRGVRWRYLYYQSEDLQTLRRHAGDYGPRKKAPPTKVRVRIPMKDLGHVYVSVLRDHAPRGQIDPPTEIKVPCTNPHVVGRTFWQHEVILDELRARKKDAENHTDYKQAFVRLFNNALEAMGLKADEGNKRKITLTGGQAPRFAGVFLGGAGQPALQETITLAKRQDLLEEPIEESWQEEYREQPEPQNPDATRPPPEHDELPVAKPAETPSASHWAVDDIFDDPNDFL